MGRITQPPAARGRRRRRTRVVAALLPLALLLLAAPNADAQRCPGNRSRQGAMWLSIAHPGLGEYYLQHWSRWEDCPQKKFWLGFIPLYGWPGYLQVKSAVDAYHCRTNDRLTFR
jgi:hypothetical protein